jgi:hypothetical protein
LEEDKEAELLRLTQIYGEEAATVLIDPYKGESKEHALARLIAEVYEMSVETVSYMLYALSMGKLDEGPYAYMGSQEEKIAYIQGKKDASRMIAGVIRGERLFKEDVEPLVNPMVAARAHANSSGWR